MKSLFSFLLLGVLFFSCIEDEGIENPVELDGRLNISLVPRYPLQAEDFWVVIHDLEGKPIAHQQMPSGGTMGVELDDSKRYHLTTYLKTRNGDFQSELLETYAYISVAEDITLGLSPTSAPTPPVTGDFRVDMTGVEFPFGAYVTSNIGGMNHSFQLVNGHLEMTASYHQGVTDYMVVAKDQNGQTRYKMLKVTGPDAKLSYKFSDLNAYDRTMKFKRSDFSQFYFSSVALDRTDSGFARRYRVNGNNYGVSFDAHSEYELGFINSFELYEIVISGNRSANAKTFFTYRKIGAVPASISLPIEHTVQPQSQLVSDFRFTKPPGVTNWFAVWDQSDRFVGPPYASLRWFVFGSESSVQLSLPAELVMLNPKLQNLANFKLESTEIVTHSQSYDEQMRGKLVELAKPTTLEMTSIRQSFF
ncbi:hypothetical protein J0A68_19055 [Algoriphagus sp. H41]|uniref:Lipoprotein n=1 Tax=Algoriphagus oliviformis TaxID=2811231 RepID=A0ABS3CA78_9BACT|nr:hypothetical protein [Algoriphagus oliviformis]MBN7813061.1 hypothetical protein [Algoriphagus oliviformis]